MAMPMCGNDDSVSKCLRESSALHWLRLATCVFSFSRFSLSVKRTGICLVWPDSCSFSVGKIAQLLVFQRSLKLRRSFPLISYTESTYRNRAPTFVCMLTIVNTNSVIFSRRTYAQLPEYQHSWWIQSCLIGTQFSKVVPVAIMTQGHCWFKTPLAVVECVRFSTRLSMGRNLKFVCRRCGVRFCAVLGRHPVCQRQAGSGKKPEVKSKQHGQTSTPPRVSLSPEEGWLLRAVEW